MRVILSIVVLGGLVAVAAGAVGVAGSLVEIWDRLKEGPAIIYYGLLFFMVAIAALATWLVRSILVPGRRSRKRVERDVVSRESVEQRVVTGRDSGIEIEAAERELAELNRRKEAGTLFLCLVGEISTGKSSLIAALAPDADVATGVTGGTTADVDHYRWRTPSGDEVVLADVPGTGSGGEGVDETGLNEALRAHVVAYVCDGDLGRAQFRDLKTLIAMDKPVVLVLNKGDRYDDEETAMLCRRLEERLSEAGAGDDREVVVVSAVDNIAVIDPGSDEDGARPRVEALQRALQRQIDRSADALDDLRDTAVFRMVAASLDEAEAAHRRERADKTVESYTRKAVVGALAAVSPGTDVLIQGYLGTALVRELCAIFDVPASDIDTGRLLDLSQGYVGKSLPILLAVAGNALKAFPGVGTIAGGLTHAVAYGLIFDALGRGLTGALEEGGELRPATAARKFGENLSEDLRSRTIRLARLALEEKKRDAK